VHRFFAALDVEYGSLASALQGARFDNKVPTLWILEGLTYYLSATTNQLLFQTMAALSAPGSMFVASMAPQTLVEKASQLSRGGLMSLWMWGFPSNFGLVLPSTRHACVLGGAMFLPLASRRFAPVVQALPSQQACS
jgi:O-methyltransferase involved in polyketide biosynthesis